MARHPEWDLSFLDEFYHKVDGTTEEVDVNEAGVNQSIEVPSHAKEPSQPTTALEDSSVDP